MAIDISGEGRTCGQSQQQRDYQQATNHDFSFGNEALKELSPHSQTLPMFGRITKRAIRR
jgi:hypothetical protein